MSFSIFKRSKKKAAEAVDVATTEVLYLSDEAEQAPGPADAAATALSAAPSVPTASDDLAPRKAGLFTQKSVNHVAPAATAPATEEVRLFEEAVALVAAEPGRASPQDALPTTAAPATKDDKRKVKKESSKKKEAKADVEAWRKGVKGRASQVFIGFLSSSSKADAIKYAIGVAEHNAVNVVNTAYAVYPWNDGWAYEVQEGGPMRAYLPSILKFYDAHNEHAKGDDLVITIATGGRSVRVERSHAGLVAFLMPESFAGEQTPWLEPGPKLKPAVPVRMGVLAAGGALFATGFLAMMLALAKRPDPLPLQTSTRNETRYEQLPISQWPTLLSAASTGYVDSLEYSGGHWKISRATSATQEPTPAVTAVPPPLPPAAAQGK